jgi:excisionase family DNA binding protein
MTRSWGMSQIVLDDEELFTVEELAAKLKVPKSWIYERVRARKGLKLPHIKMGHYLRFERSAVDEFLKRQRKSYLTLQRTD